MILAQALYNGPRLVKKVVMEMTGSRMFPIDHVTDAMANMQQIIHTEAPTKNSEQTATNMCFPVMSVTKIERLDEIIKELKVIKGKLTFIRYIILFFVTGSDIAKKIH